MGSIVEDRKKNLLSLGLIFLLLGITLRFLLKDNELSALFALIHQADGRWLLLGLAVMAGFFALEALCIQLLMRQLNYRLGFGRCYAYSLIDFYFSSITPGCCGGQPSQIYFMDRDGIPIGASSLVLLMFNLAYHLAALVIIGGIMALRGGQVLAEMGFIKYFLIYGAAAQLFLVIAFVTVVFSRNLMPRLAGGAVSLLARIRLVKDREAALAKLDEQAAEYRGGAAFIRENPSIMLKLLVIALLHLIAYYSMAYWVYRAFGLNGASPLTLISMQALLALSMESLPIPGGVGVMEGAFVLLYSGAFGESLVLPAMLLTRGLNYYFWLLLGGMVSAGALRLTQKRAALAEERRRAAAKARAVAAKAKTAASSAAAAGVKAAAASAGASAGALALERAPRRPL